MQTAFVDRLYNAVTMLFQMSWCIYQCIYPWFPGCIDSHVDRIHSFLIADPCLDNIHVGMQLVPWKKNLVQSCVKLFPYR